MAAGVLRRELIEQAIRKLDDDKFEEFKNKLATKSYDNESIFTSQMEKAKRPYQVANAIIALHTEDRAVEVTLQVLKDVDENDVAAKLRRDAKQELDKRKRHSDETLDDGSSKKLKRSEKENERPKRKIQEAITPPSSFCGREPLAPLQEYYNHSDIEKTVDAEPSRLVSKLIQKLPPETYDKLRTGLRDKTLKPFRFKGVDVYNRIEAIDQYLQGTWKGDFPMQQVSALLFKESAGQGKSQKTKDTPSATTSHDAGTVSPGKEPTDDMTPGTKVHSPPASSSSNQPPAPYIHATSSPPHEFGTKNAHFSFSADEPKHQSLPLQTQGKPRNARAGKDTVSNQMNAAIKKFFSELVVPGIDEKTREAKLKELRESQNKITERGHQKYQCLIADNLVVYKDPEDNKNAILEIKLPKKTHEPLEKSSHFGDVFNKSGFSKKEKFLMLFNMGVIGSVSKTTVYFSGAKNPVETFLFSEDDFALFTKRFERCFSELLVPVFALYKELQKEQLFGPATDQLLLARSTTGSG